MPDDRRRARRSTSIEMDAASQRGIDDVREIRERVILQPVEGRYKVYILDEAHQLTDAAFNALLKLIEEPPPHLVFIFCTTDLTKMLPTVRSRCQTFRFERPRLGELTRLLRRVADGEGIEAPDAALALMARSARGSFRDAVSTLDQLASATDGDVTVAGRARAARSGRGGGAVPALRPRRRPGHGRRAHVRRGARRAGAGHGSAGHRPARASSPPDARAAPGRGARLDPGHGGDPRPAAGPGEPARAGRGDPARRPARRRRRRDPRGRRPSAAARARARQGDPPSGRPLTRVAPPSPRAAGGAREGTGPGCTGRRSAPERHAAAVPGRQSPLRSRTSTSSRCSTRGARRCCPPSRSGRSRRPRCCARRSPSSSPGRGS